MNTKKKMGRPKKQPDELRSEKIDFRVTKAELKAIDEERKKQGNISRSDLLMRPWRNQKKGG